MANKRAIVVDLALAKKVWRVVSRGLVQGIGSPEPGRMCVEAAVCYALDLPHNDEPPCVGKSVRGDKIEINDCNWSSDKARGRGLRDVAIAQLGSNKINQKMYANVVARLVAQRLVAPAINAHLRVSTKLSDKDRARLTAAADKLVSVVATTPARSIAAALRSAHAALVNYIDKYDNTVYPLRIREQYEESAVDLSYLLDAASDRSFESIVSCAGEFWATAEPSKKAKEDKWLLIAAEIVLDALRECNSPGVKLLDELTVATAA